MRLAICRLASHVKSTGTLSAPSAGVGGRFCSGERVCGCARQARCSKDCCRWLRANGAPACKAEIELGELSIWHWLIVLIVVMLLFGSGKVSTLMGDFAKGIKAFRNTMQQDDESASAPGRKPEALAAESAGENPDASQRADKTLVNRES
jgi:sec-independent protein translocase protein TatA